MNTFLFENEEEKKYALACLAFSKSLNLIDDDSLEGVKRDATLKTKKEKHSLKAVKPYTVLLIFHIRLFSILSLQD